MASFPWMSGAYFFVVVPIKRLLEVLNTIPNGHPSLSSVKDVIS